MAAALWWNSPMFQQVYLPLFIYIHTLLALFVFTRKKKKAHSNGIDKSSVILFYHPASPVSKHSFQSKTPCAGKNKADVGEEQKWRGRGVEKTCYTHLQMLVWGYREKIPEVPV